MKVEALEDSNPYKPTKQPVVAPSMAESESWVRSALLGALWSILSAFPITAVLALVFRFPAPFVGIDRGISHVIPALIGLFFYGVLMGGFIVLGFCGAVAGLASRLGRLSPVRQQRLRCWLAVAATSILLFILATLDWYIGPW